MVRIQRVHTVICLTPPGVCIFILCRFGLIFLGVRLLIYILSWATLFPKTVVFPQISQRMILFISLFRAFGLKKAGSARRRPGLCRGRVPF